MVLPLKVSCASVQKCDDEEHRIEVGDDASGTNDGTPGQTHEPVGDVVGLAAVLPEATCKKTIPNKCMSE
jgi:hypothetical protein